MRTALLVLLLVAAAPGRAQAPALPPWAVPVLRLVSETHVQPTTGIVLPGGERVLVSADFGGPGDEIVVLDGGTDIVRHGRPARPEQVFAALGLKVLAVPGLQRAGAPLAPAMPRGRASIRLAAFPPAEQIAEGQPPVDWRGALQPVPGGAYAALSGPERPNVTGPMLDACDNLVGISLSAGLPTLAPSAGTRYHWQDELAALWAELGLAVTGRDCAAEPEPASPTEPGADETQPSAAPAAVTGEPEETTDPTEAVPPESTAEPAAEPGEDPPELPETSPPAEDATPAAEPGEPAAPSRALAWLAGFALLLIGAGLALRARRRRTAAAPPVLPATTGATGGESAPAGAVHLEVEPEHARATDGTLVLAGRYADGRPLEMRLPVDTRAIDLVIGRGGADAVLDSPAVSRRHARLEGRAGALTLADLGSSNGTSIDGIPCFEGEVFFVQPGAAVVLGDVRFSIELRAGGAGEAP